MGRKQGKAFLGGGETNRGANFFQYAKWCGPEKEVAGKKGGVREIIAEG